MTTVPYTFGNESSPIPLSQLDANFAINPQYANTAGNVVNAYQANITSVGTLTSLSVSGNVNSGNLRTTGSVSATGNIVAGNIATGGAVSAFGTVTGGAFTTTGNITGGNISGNIVAANITASGSASVTGNIAAQGIISATGNIVTSQNFVGNFLGNITGNISAGGSNTQVFFNLDGLVGAVGGLTYNKDSNTFAVLGRVNTQTFAATGVATAPTATTGTANNQIATTGFVNNQLNAYANNVAITGGNITANNITATTVSTATWTIREYSGTLYFQHSSSNIAKLDSSGNFTTIGNVTGFGTV
jgi:hypothetical protein